MLRFYRALLIFVGAFSLACNPSKQTGSSQEKPEVVSKPTDARSLRAQVCRGHENDCILFGGAPVSQRPVKILENTGYVVGYDEERKEPLWVGYRLGGKKFIEPYKRKRNFHIDNRTEARVSAKDYSHSGFARGHLAPSYAIFSRFGEDAERQTYSMSDVVPQDADLNSGRWSELESLIAGSKTSWSDERVEVWVVTGPIASSNSRRLKTGITVPDELYKVVFDIDEQTGELNTLAFIFPNRPVEEPLASFLVSISAVESKAGVKLAPLRAQFQAICCQIGLAAATALSP